MFVIIIMATVTASLKNNGWGNYSQVSSEITEGLPLTKTGQIYYNRLSRLQQYVYDTVCTAADELKPLTEDMPFVCNQEDVQIALNALMLDKPEYFYLDTESFSLGDYSFTETDSEGGEEVFSGPSIINNRYTRLRMYYTYQYEDLVLMKTRMDAAISKAMSVISGMQEDIDIQARLHDYITEICQRATSAPDNPNTVSNAYGALVDGSADSAGYHKAFKLLLNKAGMISHIAQGKVNGKSAVWCVVLVGDKYYNTDVYENDLDSQYDGKTFRGIYTHAFMNLSDGAISKTHTEKDSSAPKCTDGETYYTLKGLYSLGEDATADIIASQLDKFVKYKREYVEVYCAYETNEKEVAAIAKEQFLLSNSEYLSSGVECTAVMPIENFNAYTVHISYTLDPVTDNTEAAQ